MPASRSATPSAVSATHSPSHPASSAARADGDRAVAVAVGLDDGPHAGRRDGLAQHADVVGEGVEVDLGPRPAARTVVASSRGGRAPSGRAVDEVAGDEPGAPGPRGRASAWSHAAGRRGAERSMPVASRAPTMPDSTSPVPAVASRASPLATTSTSPPGAATTVDRPLSSTTARRSAASRRTASEAVGARAVPGEQPVLAVVRRQHGRRRAPVRAPGAAPSASQASANSPSPSTTSGHGRRRSTVARTAATVSARARGRARRRGRGSGRGRRAPALDQSNAGSRRRTTSARRRRRRRPASTATPSRCRRAAPPPTRGGRRRSCRGCRRRPARRAPLVRVGGRGRHHRGDVVGLDELGAGPGGCRGRCRRPRRRRPGCARRRAAGPA